MMEASDLGTTNSEFKALPGQLAFLFEGACGVPNPLIIINNTVGVPQSSGESVDIGQLTIGHVDHWTANSSDPPCLLSRVISMRNQRWMIMCLPVDQLLSLFQNS